MKTDPGVALASTINFIFFDSWSKPVIQGNRHQFGSQYIGNSPPAGVMGIMIGDGVAVIRTSGVPVGVPDTCSAKKIISNSLPASTSVGAITLNRKAAPLGNRAKNWAKEGAAERTRIRKTTAHKMVPFLGFN